MIHLRLTLKNKMGIKIALMMTPIKYNVKVKLTFASLVPGNELIKGLAIPPGMYQPIPKQNMTMHKEINAGTLILVTGLRLSNLVASCWILFVLKKFVNGNNNLLLIILNKINAVKQLHLFLFWLNKKLKQKGFCNPHVF